MLKSILLVGCRGSMGRRYSAILEFLGVDFEGIDIDEKPTRVYDGVILATPTNCHVDDLYYYLTDVPVLCEKPISKDFGAVKMLCRHVVEKGWDLRVVNQYEYLVNDSSTGITAYDYFRSGNDGLAYDCFNIIGLANGEIYLRNKMPVWTCMINGHPLSLSDMDTAYVKMIRSWIGGSFNNIDYVLKAHTKLQKYIEEAN